MDTKDYILIALSSCAIVISLISLVITLIQKNRETHRTIRKTLTDTLENISKIEIETTRLKNSKDVNFGSESIIQLRRNFNTQRRILMVHADFLIQKYDKLATDIDCNLLAVAYSIVGDQEKAEYFWGKSICKTKSLPIKHMNLRGFGIFYFENSNIDKGREKFLEALGMNLIENDSNNVLVSDTYLMLAEYERDFKNKNMYEQYLTKSMEICSKIINPKRRNEMEERIRLRLPKE